MFHVACVWIAFLVSNGKFTLHGGNPNGNGTGTIGDNGSDAILSAV